MRKSVSFSKISGNINAPASKSALQRIAALAWLSQDETIVHNPYYSNDVISSLGMVASLGANVIKEKSFIRIDSTGCLGKLEGRGSVALDCGESGLAIRMFSPVVSLSGCSFTLTSSGSLSGRPASVITETLSAFGVEAKDSGGYPPLRIKGPLRGGKATVDGSMSSQILTGLLLALPAAPEDSEVMVSNLKSRPYIDMTVDLASQFGCWIENMGYEVFRVKGSQKYVTPGEITAEGDWSSASFLIAAALLSGSGTVRIGNLRPDSTQADRAFLDVAAMCGAEITCGSSHVDVHPVRGQLRAFDFDATDCPDLFPPLAALATGCGGVSRIHGVQRLRHKESDREKSLIGEFSKGGIEIGSDGRTMTIRGPARIDSFNGNSHNDHRIAMALATAALAGRGRVTIENAGAVSKSYPGFFSDIKKLGGKVDE